MVYTDTQMFGILYWVVFSLVVVLIFFFDLGIFSKAPTNKQISTAQSIVNFTIILMVSAVFAWWIYVSRGTQHALDFITCYVLELSLSIDNLFVFILIFRYMNINECYQHRVLLWGIIGAVILRFIFIYCGFAIVNNFSWVFYAFGVIMLYSAYATIMHKKKHTCEQNVKYNAVLKFFTKILPVNTTINDGRFFVYNSDNKKIYATPLFLSLLLIEQADILFAGESITAALSLTNEVFLVFTANIFAIIGLRSMYFFMKALLQQFSSLNYGLAVIFAFMGGKMILDLHHAYCSTGTSLSVIFSAIFVSCVADVVKRKRDVT